MNKISHFIVLVTTFLFCSVSDWDHYYIWELSGKVLSIYDSSAIDTGSVIIYSQNISSEYYPPKIQKDGTYNGQFMTYDKPVGDYTCMLYSSSFKLQILINDTIYWIDTLFGRDIDQDKNEIAVIQTIYIER